MLIGKAGLKRLRKERGRVRGTLTRAGENSPARWSYRLPAERWELEEYLYKIEALLEFFQRTLEVPGMTPGARFRFRGSLKTTPTVFIDGEEVDTTVYDWVSTDEPDWCREWH